MTMHRLPDAERVKTLTTDQLRAGFLVEHLFVPGELVTRHVDLDRALLLGAVPLDRPLPLEAPASIRAGYFAERRELGLLNIGGAGIVTVDGRRFELERADVLYVGRGSREISVASADAGTPARFYGVSYPAHADHPTTLVTRAAAETSELGASETANARRLAKYIHPSGAASAQLVMGVTTLASGSVWNTMPSHTHARRTEVYLYFDLASDAVVIHLMGEANETRHLVVRDGDVVLSPAWSIHSGCGTSRYAFCWAMGGENQDFADMQSVHMRELK
ncbi:MAG: 5-dehydro-4-deoxy-D-glucuronate isomerase [Gemmatimonadales bacterium]